LSNMNETFDFPVEDWEAIPLETFKNLLAEVKERFNHDIEEVVSVTDKAIKYEFGFLTFLLGTGVFIFAHNQESIWYFSPLLVLSAYNVYKGYTVIKSRPLHSNGLLPANVLSKDYNLSSDFTEEQKEKLFYYKAIQTYMVKIEQSRTDNHDRAKEYDTFSGLTLLLIFAISVFLLMVISVHSASVGS
jgi:hypothetical protein